ncbi:MAG: hypothetical protein U0R49_00755 [Fimbriimonadales bacterium]
MDWQKISTLDRRWLYLCLFIVVAWQTMFPLKVQNVVSPMSAGLFDYLNSLNEGDFIVIQSDWTMSTQGESQGQFQSLIKLLARKKIRFVVTSVSDPACPDIAKANIKMVLEKEPGGKDFKENEFWAVAGYFPNAENHNTNMVNNIRQELRAKGVTTLPVMNGIDDLSDTKAVVVVTGTSSALLWYERMNNKTQLGMMLTAVMAGENIPYYLSRQSFGLVIGAKGAYDMETKLAEAFPDPKFPNYDNGKRFMSPLAFALFLLIFAVIVGNVAGKLARKQSEQQ